MPKFTAYFSVIGTASVEVEAANEEEAEAKAERAIHVGLCHQCSREVEGLEVEEFKYVEETT